MDVGPPEVGLADPGRALTETSPVGASPSAEVKTQSLF
jgi:hypothetical protein